MVRNKEGELMGDNVVSLTGNFSPLGTELLARIKGGHPICLQGLFRLWWKWPDSMEVARLVNSDEPCWPEEGAIVQEIKMHAIGTNVVQYQVPTT